MAPKRVLHTLYMVDNRLHEVYCCEQPQPEKTPNQHTMSLSLIQAPDRDAASKTTDLVTLTSTELYHAVAGFEYQRLQARVNA